MRTIIASLARLLTDAIEGASDEEVALRLIDAAFESGVPASVLAQHLSAKAAANAELAADLAQALKTRGR